MYVCILQSYLDSLGVDHHRTPNRLISHILVLIGEFRSSIIIQFSDSIEDHFSSIDCILIERTVEPSFITLVSSILSGQSKSVQLFIVP